MAAEVTKRGLLDMQVCVPVEATDDEVLRFAEREFPCGTEAGWQIRRAADEHLRGMPERNPCEERAGHVHIMLDA